MTGLKRAEARAKRAAEDSVFRLTHPNDVTGPFEFVDAVRRGGVEWDELGAPYVAGDAA